MPDLSTCLIAFSNGQCVAKGNPEQAVTYLKSFFDQHPQQDLLILDAETSRTIELDLRQSPATILSSQFLSEPETATVSQALREPKRGRGRPKLGVVSREVTLLPRHWEWLSKQPGGASVALRRLVEEARSKSGEQDRQRAAQNSAYQFMTVVAGNEEGYEEAIRSLYAGDLEKLLATIKKWPTDVARHTASLAEAAIKCNQE
ncbi:MAG: DUF2239 family protein [Gammaproteobacteria bacterium]|nr:DUF2239 family protein [Gammaproteobacteria bacterium]